MPLVIRPGASSSSDLVVRLSTILTVSFCCSSFCRCCSSTCISYCSCIVRGQVGSRKRLSSSWFSGLDFGNLIVYPMSSNHSSNVMSRIWKDCSHCCMKNMRKFSLVNKENVLGRASSTLLRIKICGIFALRSQHTNVSFDLEVSNFFLR